jgi:hypothetical protein
LVRDGKITKEETGEFQKYNKERIYRMDKGDMGF